MTPEREALELIVNAVVHATEVLAEAAASAHKVLATPPAPATETTITPATLRTYPEDTPRFSEILWTRCNKAADTIEALTAQVANLTAKYPADPK